MILNVESGSFEISSLAIGIRGDLSSDTAAVISLEEYHDINKLLTRVLHSFSI